MKISTNRGDLSLLETEPSQSRNHRVITRFTDAEINTKPHLLPKFFFKISFPDTTVLWVEQTAPHKFSIA